jgi:hypothetical protein
VFHSYLLGLTLEQKSKQKINKKMKKRKEIIRNMQTMDDVVGLTKTHGNKGTRLSPEMSC